MSQAFDYAALRKELLSLAQPSYQQFASSLLPGVKNVMGVRLPSLRKIAKRIAKQDFISYLQNPSHQSFEETMLHGLVLGYIKTDLPTRFSYLKAFVPTIDNWSVCDSVCITLKAVREDFNQTLLFLAPYLASANEYEVRFALVMLLYHFLNEEFYPQALKAFCQVSHPGYYAQMAAAWGIASVYTLWPKETYSYVASHMPPMEIAKKAVQKIHDSLQISPQNKRLADRWLPNQ